jgi:hypothetical protein
VAAAGVRPLSYVIIRYRAQHDLTQAELADLVPGMTEADIAWPEPGEGYVDGIDFGPTSGVTVASLAAGYAGRGC